MDRLLPTQRPERKVGGHQKWRDLLFVHWTIPEEALRPLIPAELTIDTWEGQAYIGIVPFLMLDVAPSWWPSRFAFHFLETNLRTYVHHHGENPGVFFFSLDAASRLAVRAARMGWGLPYFYATMAMKKEDETLWYEMTRRAKDRPSLRAHYTVREPLDPAEPDTLEFFLLERYLLYAKHRGRLKRGQVYHTPYPAHLATLHDFEESLIAAAGLPAPEEPPPLVHYAPGVDVDIFNLEVVAE